MSNLKRGVRAIQQATGWSYQACLNQLRKRDGNGKTLDENVAETIDAMREADQRAALELAADRGRL